jgi:lipopolysaccharide heptosyltransferase II
VKVLILKPSSLGDVIQALPVLRLIKLHLPQSEIYWWLDHSLTPLLEGDPDLAGIIPFNRKRWSSPWHWNEVWSSVQHIRAHHFDWVIDLQSLLRSGAMAWFANGTFTVGLDDAREGARGFYDVAIPRHSYATHAVDWYLDVLPALNVPVHRNFAWLPERAPVAQAVRDKWHPEGSRWIALQPGARWLNKRWPAEYFAAFAKELASGFGDVRFAIFGSGADRPLGETIARALPDRCLDLTGRTSLSEMIEWTRLCELMVTNDTGPMHVAAALGKPVVGIFGPTDPRRTGPYGQLHHALQHPLPCVPCMKDSCRNARPLECLHAIRPGEIVARVTSMLAPGSSQPR